MHPSVTRREREVLQLIGDHLTHEEIGRRLFISPRTVETHVAALRRKLALPDHRALVRYAAEHGPLPPGGARPAPLTSFVGRASELAGLSTALTGARLVSAVGPGGIGKTRLALAAVERVAPGFDDVRWVDLVPLPDGELLAEVVAAACGAVASSRRTPGEALAAALRGRRVLLVLDNCEHHVNAVALLVERLGPACPGLTVLVTSRVRLALPFERVFRVEGLTAGPEGDAVTLFAERVTAAGGADLRNGDRARAVEVCAALGGLPLAVELAAVRLPALGLDGIEAALVDQDRLLTGGSRSSPRHRSMHETLDWSRALLTPAADALLRRLAVLVAPFDATAAAAVAAFPPLADDDVPGALGELVDHSLLAAGQAGGRRLHRMLEPVRQAALAGLTDSDGPVFARHAAWCGREVDRLLATRDTASLDAVAGDVRAALARQPDGAQEPARGFGLLLFRAGRLREAQQRLEQAGDLVRAAAVAKCRVLGEEALRLELAAAAGADDPRAAALALARAAETVNRFGGMFAGPPAVRPDELVARARALAPEDRHVAAALALATVAYTAGSGPGPEVAAALAAAREVGDVLLESAGLDALGSRTLFAGDVVRAHRLAGERVARLRSWQDEPAAALELKDALHMAAICALGAGDLAAAREMGRLQHELPFLAEARDLADEEMLAPDALAGDWHAVLDVADRFLDDWEAAGRPVAPGRALGPTAVALVHGLRGDSALRTTWLGVVADLRGVPQHEAARGTGYGELFEAMTLLQAGRPDAALAVLEAPVPLTFHGRAFGQWTAAVRAEAAVLAGAPDAAECVRAAGAAASGNPVATALARRAGALLRADATELVPLADELERLGVRYQADRTRDLARTGR